MPSDPLHDKPLYPADNRYGIPALRYTPVSALPHWLIPYRTRVRPGQSMAGGAVHFFLFDGIFESVWNCPHKTARYLAGFTTVLTPDFSLNTDMPLAAQVWNTYRTRWCGAHWQAHGYQVVPTAAWSTPASYDFCFLGLPQHGPVALTTLGSRSAGSRAAFLHGFAALLERIQPAVVLCYGTPLPEMEMRVPLQVYPDRWQDRKSTRLNSSHRN